MPGQNRETETPIGSAQYWGNGDLTEVTISETDWQEVASVQSTKSQKYFPGYGTSDRDGNSGFADFDAEATGGGSANDGDEVNVKFRYVVYADANKDFPIWFGPDLDAASLRAAVGSNRSEKPMVPQQAHGAPEDGYVVLEIKGKDSDADGAVLESDDTDHSGTILDLGFPYTEVKTVDV